MLKPYSELSYREKLILDIWEAYKDAHGVRPRHIKFEDMQDKELEDVYSNICKHFVE